MIERAEVVVIGSGGSAKLERFAEDTGQPLAWTRSGSLKVARRPEDAEVLEGECARARRFGLDAELISPQDAHRLNPFLAPAGVFAVMWVAEDLYFEPSQVAVGFARDPHPARSHSPPAVRHRPDRRRSRRSADGADHRRRGLRPAVRGRVLWGVFEDDPRQFDMDALGGAFDVADLQLDRDVLWRAAEDVEQQLPALREASVREHRGGLPTMTADGRHIVGPAPGSRGFFIAGGCNVAGLSISPAIGDALAAWIVEGTPPYELTPLSLERFRGPPSSEHQLAKAAAWQYRHFYGAG